MRTKTLALFILIITSLSMAPFAMALGSDEQHELMSATGTFEVKLEPQKDDEFPVGRMLMNKTFSGDLQGTGKGQMISKRTESGHAIYYAIEEVEGSLNGKTGAFTLQHAGVMSNEGQSLSITIMEGSGSGELQNISGNFEVIQENDQHKYILNYKL